MIINKTEKRPIFKSEMICNKNKDQYRKLFSIVKKEFKKKTKSNFNLYIKINLKFLKN